MQLQFFIEGNVYLANVKRVKGKTKLFFKTNDVLKNAIGFDLPSYCCGNIKCRRKSLRRFKEDLLNGKYTHAVIIPE